MLVSSKTLNNKEEMLYIPAVNKFMLVHKSTNKIKRDAITGEELLPQDTMFVILTYNGETLKYKNDKPVGINVSPNTLVIDKCGRANIATCPSLQ